MRKTLMAVSLLASCAAIATQANATTTWEGISTGVTNYETGETDYYTVRFTFDDSAPLFVTPLIAQDPAHTPFTRAWYGNITSFTVTGVALGTVGFDSGYSYVSTLAPALAQYGSVPFSVTAGSDGSAPGYQLQFSYTPASAYGSTAMPGALDVGAAGTDSGFNLLRYAYEGDPADEYIGDPESLLSFHFASGGYLPAATAVPEPATWAMMLAGFGLVGIAMRRRARVNVAYS